MIPLNKFKNQPHMLYQVLYISLLQEIIVLFLEMGPHPDPRYFTKIIY
jgi:hypothetical protein